MKSRIWPVTVSFFLIGVGLASGQMPFDLPFVGFASLILVGFIWQRLSLNLVSAFKSGVAFGLGYFSVTFLWIFQPFLVEPSATGWMAPFAFVGLVTCLSFCWGLAFFFAEYLANKKSRLQRLLMLWAILSLVEILRSDFVFNFPWGLISAIWINTSISQILALVGPNGLTSLIILSAFLISKPIFSSFLGLFLIAALSFIGSKHFEEPLSVQENQLLIRIIQPNIPQSKKWKSELAREFLELHLSLSQSENDEPIDLVVWPETAINYFFELDTEIQKLIQQNIDTPLILGLRRFEPGNKKLFNSAYFLNQNGEVEFIYDKTHLVPFGEYIPLGDFFSRFGLFGLATDGITGFTPGLRKGVVRTLGIPPVSISICYETIFSREIDYTSHGAKWLLQITNDAWFGSFNGPPQHLTLARMRAIEQGLPLIRSANTGISVVTDPFGKVLKKIDLGKRGYIDVALPANISSTVYSRVGGSLINIYIILALVLTILSLLFIKSRKLTRV
ncbi:MAG: apolipoprotein N-acyltransferase [Pseudomonadota bacterium]|nr:apolipoprotein N-acyltransferase [Pseudomonadota bacterium]